MYPKRKRLESSLPSPPPSPSPSSRSHAKASSVLPMDNLTYLGHVQMSQSPASLDRIKYPPSALTRSPPHLFNIVLRAGTSRPSTHSFSFPLQQSPNLGPTAFLQARGILYLTFYTLLINIPTSFLIHPHSFGLINLSTLIPIFVPDDLRTHLTRSKSNDLWPATKVQTRDIATAPNPTIRPSIIEEQDKSWKYIEVIRSYWRIRREEVYIVWQRRNTSSLRKTFDSGSCQPRVSSRYPAGRSRSDQRLKK